MPPAGWASAAPTSGSNGVTTDEMSEAVAGFHFPDELWAGIVYDLVVAARFGAIPIERLVAALVPLYFGRVGSLVVECRNLARAMPTSGWSARHGRSSCASRTSSSRWRAAAGRRGRGRPPRRGRA